MTQDANIEHEIILTEGCNTPEGDVPSLLDQQESIADKTKNRTTDTVEVEGEIKKESPEANMFQYPAKLKYGSELP